VPEQIIYGRTEHTARGKEPPTGLILMPRDARFEKITRIIADCLWQMHVRPITLDTQVEYAGIVSDARSQIPRAIESADIVIVDITSANPDVMYELGFAHALKKPVLPLVRRSESSIPSDLQGYLYYPYDENDEHELIDRVQSWVDRALAKLQ
jgi:hypothetical protein